MTRYSRWPQSVYVLWRTKLSATSTSRGWSLLGRWRGGNWAEVPRGGLQGDVEGNTLCSQEDLPLSAGVSNRCVGPQKCTLGTSLFGQWHFHRYYRPPVAASQVVCLGAELCGLSHFSAFRGHACDCASCTCDSSNESYDNAAPVARVYISREEKRSYSKPNDSAQIVDYAAIKRSFKYSRACLGNGCWAWPWVVLSVNRRIDSGLERLRGRAYLTT